ncbi:hypothetical protein OsI_35793 [Oryza sativa Indica Group]|uniref:Exocyst complex component Sec3 PIP2-binding N-terminal domain-containing protein n=1 Tax=Oryza sativa subsp. indica TaxID=39946 RepID=A2ZDD0_ORYSI|nr:hypothetical protein OsI_35793 [Oryza sativa Indica Group]
MARSSADDMELKRSCEAGILSKEKDRETVVMSMRVAKGRGVWGKAGKLASRHMAKPRVLAVTTKKKGQRTKAFVRVLKYSNGGVLEPAKVYKMKHLSKVEVVPNDPSGCTFLLFENDTSFINGGYHEISKGYKRRVRCIKLLQLLIFIEE